MIMPDVTIMELVRGGESDCDSTSVATSDTMNTVPTLDLTDEDAFLQLSHNSQPQQSSTGSSFPKDSRSKSSTSATSAGSSVDMESSFGDNWNIQSLFTKAQRLLSTYGLRGSVQETSETEGGIEEGEDDIIVTEPRPEHDTRFIEYPFHSQEGQTITHKDMLNTELKDKFATNLCVRGSNLTPEPITSGTPKKSKGYEHSHKRTPTWYSEHQFRSKSPAKAQKAKEQKAKSFTKLTPYVSTPRMHANLRVQPHPLKGLRHSHTPSSSNLWNEKRVFDIFVHPSTLPEVYHFMQKKSTSGSFLVELSPIAQLNKYVSRSAESESKADGSSADGSGGSRSSSLSQNQDGGLPSSLVVRLCFATHVVVRGDDMTTSLSETPQEEVPSGRGGFLVALEQGEEARKEEPRVSVSVMVGQVLMSDLVRRQLGIKECSRVKVLHVVDSWRMSFVDGIKVVVQPINYEKVSLSLVSNLSVDII
jgi:hypothetical protein